MNRADGLRYMADQPRREKVLVSWGATTDQIMAGIMEVANDDKMTAQVRAFAEKFRPRPGFEMDALHRIWKHVRHEIKYVEDGWDEQAIKEPFRTYKDGKADCKGKTLFTYHVLKALNIPCIIRFASYWDAAAVADAKRQGITVKVGQIGHVYPVALVDGRMVAMDSVHTAFDDEPTAVKIIDRYPLAWDTPEIRELAKDHRAAAIGNTAGAQPKWFRIGTGALGIGYGFRQGGLLGMLAIGLGGYQIWDAMGRPWPVPQNKRTNDATC